MLAISRKPMRRRKKSESLFQSLPTRDSDPRRVRQFHWEAKTFPPAAALNVFLRWREKHGDSCASHCNRIAVTSIFARS